MNHQSLTTTLLLAALLCALCAIFASLLPGTWWQWTSAAGLLAFAGTVNAAVHMPAKERP